MADKTDEPNTPTGESPVYDSLVDGGEPVVATVDSDSDDTEATAAPVEPDEIVVEDTDSVEYVDAEPTVVEETPVVAETPYVAPTPRVQPYVQTAAPTNAQPNVVYVNAPTPPVEKGNRGFGVLIALAATIVFLIVLAIVMFIIYSVRAGQPFVDFLGQTAFYVPGLFFLVGAVLLALVLNRAGWWTYVIGSLLVGVFVYFGTIATVLLSNNLFFLTPDAAAELFRLGTISPFTIAAALVAREVMLWAGAIVASRGRKLKVRNAEALDTFKREQAQNRGY